MITVIIEMIEKELSTVRFEHYENGYAIFFQFEGKMDKFRLILEKENGVWIYSKVLGFRYMDGTPLHFGLKWIEMTCSEKEREELFLKLSVHPNVRLRLAIKGIVS